MEEKKGILAEFKEFITKGNAIDLAVGVVLAGAFTAIVNSLVKDFIMPVVGVLMGGVNLTNLKWVLVPAAGAKAEVAITYGNFIQAVINFVIIGFVLFLFVKAINKLRKKQEEAPAEPTEEVLLLREIRDSLAGKPAATKTEIPTAPKL